MSVNSKGQVRRTYGIPGTGVFNTELVNPKHPRADTPADQPHVPAPVATEQSTTRRRWGTGTTMLITAMAATIVLLLIALAGRM